MKGTKLTNIFMNINNNNNNDNNNNNNNNNNTPFVSITWHQNGPLGSVVYSHCPTNDS